MKKTAVTLTVALGALGCNVEPVGQPTGGIDLTGGAGASGGAAGSAGAAGTGASGSAGGAAGGTGGEGGSSEACPRGLVVMNTDYLSTNISLVGLDGTVLSRSFISSASTAAGLSAPLTGDVTPPTSGLPGAEVVLLDRYPASVLTWVNLETARVRAQLSVATGFAANPHDYVQLSPERAYITRFEPNFSSGKQPFDAGNDLLELNPKIPEIVARIDMLPAMAGEDPKFFPRADKLFALGDRLVVLASAHAADFVETAPSRLIVVDPDARSIERVIVLSGMHGCSGMLPSPDGKALAVVCSGEFRGVSIPTIEASGVVVFDLPGLTERRRYRAADIAEASVGFSVAWPDPNHLLFTTLGRFAMDDQPAQDDTLVELELDAASSRVLLRSVDLPFTLGDVRCAAACNVCFATDADRNVLHRFPVDHGRLGNPSAIEVDTQTGLPPRYLGIF